MPDAPQGTVTLVFTDVVGSTALWDRVPAAMQQALDTHHEVIRAGLKRHGGYEVECEGDGFFLAFADPRAGLACCLALQSGLHEAQWPEELLGQPEATLADGHRGLRVRVGMHVGVPDSRPDPTTGRTDYVGAPVNKASRIRDAAHGGQVLLSGPAWEMVSERMADSVVWKDLGEYELRGFARPERLVQALPPALGQRRFPPVRALDVVRTNIPPAANTFVGRQADLDKLEEALEEGHRLVSVVGPPGTGKTRIARELARTRLAGYAREGGGTWFCDLSEADAGDRLVASVGRTLGVNLAPEAPLSGSVAQIGHVLASKGPMLLILDNFEHLVEHGRDTVLPWLRAAPEALLMVTTRERLGIEGETVHRLAPLPDAEGETLFRERAMAAGGRVGEGDSAVGHIVRRLDGIPLAIELAAARTGVLSPQEILERLGERFKVLRGSKLKSERHATMQAALDWSWYLLADWERGALAQASVFRGGFTLRAAEAVLDLEAHEGAPFVLDTVQSLRDKSLLYAYEERTFPGETRFGMLESVREYAGQRLAEGQDAPAAESRHAKHFLAMGDKWAEGVGGRDGLSCLDRLGVETDNLLAVMANRSEADPHAAANAALALDALHDIRGPGTTHVSLLGFALEAARATGDPALEARVLRGLGIAKGRLGEIAGARVALEEALGCAREAEDLIAETEALAGLGTLDWDEETLTAAIEIAEGAGLEDVAARSLRARSVGRRKRGETAGAREDLERALSIVERTGYRAFEAVVLESLGSLYWSEGRHEDAQRHCLRALEIYREYGNRRGEGIVTSVLGTAYEGMGRLEDALATKREALAIQREVGDPVAEGQTRGDIGDLLIHMDRDDEAEPHLRAAVAALREAGAKHAEAVPLVNMAELALRQGDPSAARGHAERVVELAAALQDGSLDVEGLVLLAESLRLEHSSAHASRAAAEALDKIAVLDDSEQASRLRTRLDWAGPEAGLDPSPHQAQ